MTGLLLSTPSTSTAYLAGSKHDKSVRSTTEIGNSKSTGNSGALYGQHGVLVQLGVAHKVLVWESKDLTRAE